MAKAKEPALDPQLSSILASIRATVSGDAPPPPADASPAPAPPPAPPIREGVPPSARTVEEFLADLIRPQVEAWLDRHLPEIVQKLASDEIRRLTGK
jgi:hypothetical protein